MSKYAIVMTLMVLALLLACDRYLDSQDPVRTAPTPIPIPMNLAAVVDDGTVTLSWELTDSSEADRFRVYLAESEEGEYLLKDSTTMFSISLSDLLLNRQAFLRVTTMTAANVESEPSISVSAAPTHFSININDDADYAIQRDVQVRFISGVSAQFLQISEQIDFSDADWESYGASKSFELSEDDGVKTVYARLQFADGSETGQPLSDEITLDTQAEIESLTFFLDTAILAVGSITTFRMQTGEVGGEASVSFGSERNLELFDDGTNGDAVADDATYTLEYTVPFGAYAFDEVVSGSFTDEAGNTAEDVTADGLMNINSTPEKVVLAVSFGVDESTVVFTWSTSTETDFESYRLMRVAPSDITLMIATSSSTNRFEMSTPTSPSDYFIYVFDLHGDSAASNTVTSP